MFWIVYVVCPFIVTKIIAKITVWKFDFLTNEVLEISRLNRTSPFNIWPFNQTQLSGMCKVKFFACMLIFTSFRIIWYAKWPHSEKKFWPFHPTDRWRVQGQNICLHGALCSIPFNLICSMITLRKYYVFTFEATQGPKVCVMTEYVLAWCSMIHSP